LKEKGKEMAAEIKEEVIEKIREHYAHAKLKHPHFCDKLSGYDKSFIKKLLEYHRAGLTAETIQNRIEANRVFLCEFYEIFDAIADGDKAAAVEECYDAIAVLLRMVDMLEESEVSQ
jgi:DNA-binding GntR family transcriptional regulator